MTTDRQDVRQNAGLSATQLHRRATRRLIILPFVGGLLLIVALTVITVLAGRQPVAAVSTTMLTVLILCPMAICALPIYLLLVVAVVGMNRAHDFVAKPLMQLEKFSATLLERTQSISDRAARTSINLNARFAPLDRLILSAFDRPAQPEDDND